MNLTFETLRERFGAAAVGAFTSPPARPAWLTELPVVSPASLEEAAEVLRFAAHAALRVLPAGAGEHLGGLAPAPGRAARAAPPAGWGGPDFVLSTRRLVRVVEYEPEEMVLVAEAGIPLRALDALLAPHAQRLPSDPWPGQASTLGGAVAAHRCGLDRLRRGPLRDAVLGARVLHADGSRSKTGGKVVKNVTGFDLAKLYAGSRGALVLLGEINLRLHPQPVVTALVVAEVGREWAEELLLAVHRSALEPECWLLVAGPASEIIQVPERSVALVARFAGNAAAVRWQVGEATRLLCGTEWPAERAAAAYESLRSGIEPRAGTVSVRITSLPTAGARVLECLERHPGWARGGDLVAECGSGVAHAHLASDAVPSDLQALRTSLAAIGARLEVEDAPGGRWIEADAIAAGVDPPARAIIARTKQTYDPQAIFPPPRELGGWA